MLDFIVENLGRLLTWLFVIGMIGCVFVIPITAYRLFTVLFEKDSPDEIKPALR